MTRLMKRTLPIALLALALMLAYASSALAASYSYSFYYNDSHHAHSSSYIYGDAEVDGGLVTITLQGGDFFPDLKVDGVSAARAYSGGLTTFTFPGNAEDNIPIELFIVAGPHSASYPLEIVWE